MVAIAVTVLEMMSVTRAKRNVKSGLRMFSDITERNKDHSDTVFPDDISENPNKPLKKNPYRVQKSVSFFQHGYQIKGFFKHCLNK